MLNNDEKSHRGMYSPVGSFPFSTVFGSSSSWLTRGIFFFYNIFLFCWTGRFASSGTSYNHVTREFASAIHAFRSFIILVDIFCCCPFFFSQFIPASGNAEFCQTVSIPPRIYVTHPVLSSVFQHFFFFFFFRLTDGPFTNEWRQFLHRAVTWGWRHRKMDIRSITSRHLPRPASSWFRSTFSTVGSESTSGYTSVNIRRPAW